MGTGIPMKPKSAPNCPFPQFEGRKRENRIKLDFSISNHTTLQWKCFNQQLPAAKLFTYSFRRTNVKKNFEIDTKAIFTQFTTISVQRKRASFRTVLSFKNVYIELQCAEKSITRSKYMLWVYLARNIWPRRARPTTIAAVPLDLFVRYSHITRLLLIVHMPSGNGHWLAISVRFAKSQTHYHLL